MCRLSSNIRELWLAWITVVITLITSVWLSSYAFIMHVCYVAFINSIRRSNRACKCRYGFNWSGSKSLKISAPTPQGTDAPVPADNRAKSIILPWYYLTISPLLSYIKIVNIADLLHAIRNVFATKNLPKYSPGEITKKTRSWLRYRNSSPIPHSSSLNCQRLWHLWLSAPLCWSHK